MAALPPTFGRHSVGGNSTPESMENSSSLEEVPRLKAKSTLTPRSFGTFFAPRNLLAHPKRKKSLRNPMVDLNPSGLNRIHEDSKTKVTTKSFAHVFDEDENPHSGSNNAGNRKRGLCSPDITPESCNRSKRTRKLYGDAERMCEQQVTSEQDSDLDASWPSPAHLRTFVQRSQYCGELGVVSRRELGLSAGISRLSLADYCPDWQSEAAHFYTGPNDVHVNKNVATRSPELALPFCTAACNTNTLVAVGDDEGAIRLLESEEDGTPAFGRSYLTFRPHQTAILDLAFSSDDLILGTASGDQTGHIIDMHTQKTIYKLRGHASSVKQVRFQPGNGNNVIATSSRDGSIQIWDLRCRGTELCAPEAKVNLGANENHITATKFSISKPKYAACVNSIPEAHLTYLNSPNHKTLGYKTSGSSLFGGSNRYRSQGRSEVSITTISFLSPSNPYFLLSGSEASATVKLWDLRMRQFSKRRTPTPLSTTSQPDVHGRHRQFGLTSMTIGSDYSRLYTLCKDNSVYVYSTAHLLLGTAPEPFHWNDIRRGGEDQRGLGPLFVFQHPKLKVSTFYVKSSIRLKSANHTEVLAVGSTDSCAILFPTNERHFQKRSRESPVTTLEKSPRSWPLTPPCSRRLFHHSSLMSGTQPLHSIPVYQTGVALVNGHEKEVTGLAWNSRGDLITVGDDMKCRVWRENSRKAASSRLESKKRGNCWGNGWAELDERDSLWDEDE